VIYIWNCWQYESKDERCIYTVININILLNMPLSRHTDERRFKRNAHRCWLNFEFFESKSTKIPRKHHQYIPTILYWLEKRPNGERKEIRKNVWRTNNSNNTSKSLKLNGGIMMVAGLRGYQLYIGIKISCYRSIRFNYLIVIATEGLPEIRPPFLSYMTS